MTEHFPSGERDGVPAQPADERHPNRKRYNATEVMRTLGYALCRHPDVKELDQLRLKVPTPSGGQATIDSYWMYMARRGAGGFNGQLHRDLLAADDGLICVSLSRGESNFNYNIAKPSALSPGTATMHFAILLDRSLRDVGDAVGELTKEHRLKGDELPVMPAELCEHFDANIASTLDEPRVFIWNAAPGKKEILLSAPEHAIHHENLRELVEAVRIPPTD